MNESTTTFTTTVQVKSISQPVAVGTKGHLKQTLVGKTDGQYPDTFEFEAFGRDRDHIERVKVGDVIEVTARPRGREWTSQKTGKTSYFTTLAIQGVRIVSGDSGEAASPADSIDIAGIDVSDTVDEDMPF